MESKRILFLTTGVINKLQGGSGQFNHKIMEIISDRKSELEIISICDENFFKSHNRAIDLPSNVKLKNIILQKKRSKINQALLLFRPIYFIEAIKIKKKIIRKLDLKNYDLVISLGLGWAIVVPDKNTKIINFFGDPVDLIHSKQIEKLNKIKKMIISLTPSKNLLSIYLKNMKNILVKKNVRLYTFLPQEKIRLEKYGIIVEQINWFTYLPDLSYKYENKKSREITFGFLGDKNTTYSNHFLNSTLQELSKIEKTFDCNVNLNIIGKNWNYSDIFKNFNSTKFMKIKLLGFVSDLSLEMSKIDFMLYLENYSIGVRTRILSAMSFKCPVIVHESARSGIPELHDNVNAIILNDCGQLNKIIRKIQKGEINRNFIINNAFELWSQKYSEKEFTKNITSIIFK